MATLNLNKKKFLSEENVAQIVKIGINFGERLNSIESETIADYDNTKTYLKGESCYHNNYIYRCKATATGDWDFSRWELIGDEITELTKDDIKDMLGLSDEELETLSNIILDSEVRLDKTYSSSKIYTDIQNAIDTAKTYTLTELGKISGASYKVVSSTSDMTDEKIIYLLNNGTNFDIYIVDNGTPTKIGDTNIDLSNHYTKTEVDNDFLKKTDATSTYATKTEINDKVDKTSIKTAISTTPSNDNVLSEKYIDENIVKKTDITTTIDSSSTDSQIPSAKAVYNNAIKDNNIKTYTTLEQLGLASGCTVEDIYLALPDNSYCEIGCSSSANDSLYVVTNVPIETSNTYGLLSIRKLNKYRFNIEYKFSGGGILLPNTLYVGQLKGIDGTGLTWRKVCTTSVNDVALTSLTYNEATSKYYTLTSGGIHSHYIVKNGICYVDVDVTCVSTKTGNWSYVFIGLPIPTSSKVRYFSMGGEDGKSNINGIMDLDGRIGLMFGTAGVRYVASFSYPVKES